MGMGPAAYVERSGSDKRHSRGYEKDHRHLRADFRRYLLADDDSAGKLRRQDWLRPGRDHRQHFYRALVLDGVCRHPHLPGQHRRWSDYLLKGFCRRPLHYADILHRLCRNLGSDLLQLPAWFLGRIWRSFGSEAHRLGSEPGGHPGKTSARQKIQRAVQKPTLQCSAHVHSSLPDWARHHAVLRVGPKAKAATATGAIALAGILKLFQRLRPRVVVGTRGALEKTQDRRMECTPIQPRYPHAVGRPATRRSLHDRHWGHFLCPRIFDLNSP